MFKLECSKVILYKDDDLRSLVIYNDLEFNIYYLFGLEHLGVYVSSNIFNNDDLKYVLSLSNSINLKEIVHNMYNKSNLFDYLTTLECLLYLNSRVKSNPVIRLRRMAPFVEELINYYIFINE